MLSVFQRHLYSSAGEAGLADLLGRIEIWVGPLTDAWRPRDEADGFFRLFEVLTDAIAAVDRVDLRTPQIRLRPSTDGDIPVGVICKLARALVEYLADGDKLAQRAAMEALAAAGHSRARAGFEQGFRAALAELFIEEGDYDQAVPAIEANLSIQSASPYSQQLLYHALLKQKQAGLIADSSRVSLDDLSNRFCEQPFTMILTLSGHNSKPDTYACNCAAWLPYPLPESRLDDAEEDGDVWNGPEARELRRSILEGDFSYCSLLMCPYIVKGSLPKRDDVTDPVMRDIIDNKRTHIASPPRRISLGHDDSCNIACPSCRSEIITARNSAREVMDSFVDRNILPRMQDAEVELYLSGDGDPIGSKHYRRLLHSLDPVRHRGVSVYLQSNGLLITPREWESLAHVQHLIKGMIISIDAAEAATYEDVRRPGKWETLTSNMEFIANLRRTGAIGWLIINFVVQKKNFEQMPAFVELGQHWSVDRVVFSKIFYTPRAGTLESADFAANAIADDDHPDHPRFLEVLKHPILRSKEVDLFNIVAGLSSDPGLDAAPNIVVSIGEHGLAELVQPPSMTVAVEEPTLSDVVEGPAKKPAFWRSLLRRREKSAV